MDLKNEEQILPDRFSTGDIRYILLEGTQLKIGLQGNSYLQKRYVINNNGGYAAYLTEGTAYYSSIRKTDFGHELTYSAPLFTGDKIEVYLDQDGQRTLLKSYEVKIENAPGEVRILNGTYIMKSRLPGATNKALDLITDSFVGNVHLWSYSNQLNAEWAFEYRQDKQAYIVWNSRRPGLVLAWNDSGGGWNVFGTPFTEAEEHYWKVKRTSKGDATIVNLKKRNGKEVVLDVEGGGTSDGTNIMVYERSEARAEQDFKLIARQKDQRASISSYYVPQSGQKNRSSNNFSLSGLGGARVRVEIHGDGESVLSFRIMRDKSNDTDPTIWSNVNHGSILTIPTTNVDGLYIANPNPNNYNGYDRNRSFTVVFYTLPNQ